MSTNTSPPAARGDGESLSQNRALSSPDTAEGSLQSLPALSDSLEASSNSQDPSRQSTARTSISIPVQHGKDINDTNFIPTIAPPDPAPTNAGLDPVSAQIYLRTNSNTEPSIAQRLRNTTRPDSPSPDLQRLSSDLNKSPNVFLDPSKERRFGRPSLENRAELIVGFRKGASFLSLWGMRNSWRKDDDMQDSDSELGDLRTDGTNARALTSVIGTGGGYIPLYKEPPRYIRVRSHNKKERDFNHLFLAQELVGGKRPVEQEIQGRTPATAVGRKLLSGGDAIWAADFSLDGKYLAVAGKDQMVRVFAVISTPEERKAHEEEETQNGNSGEKLSAPVFRNKPIREFHGHTGEVLALSWSKNNFLLSCSMDKTIRLWHASREDCLCTFAHKDVVTSIAFHPTDDRFFLAGSLDAQLRLWSIPDKSVAFAASAGEFITAVAFTPDGKTAICGSISGMCTFYETEGLKYKYQIHARSSRGKNSKGSKITGIRTMQIPVDAENSQIKVLITSNDSRIRIYNLDDRLLEVKYKGLEIQSSQIHARFSDDGKYIICGSEDRKAYMWKLGADDYEFKDRQPYESFDAHPEVVTTAVMAPTKTRQLLSASGDPVYDLCNPPRVMLRSLEESTASQTALSDSSHGDIPVAVKKPEESPAYIERSKHFDGNILITTDRRGIIKVFRQDCAYVKRQQGLWETGSKFSGRIAGVGRSGSVVTRTSAGSRIQSRRASLNLGPNPIQAQHPSDRINSWRQDIDGAGASLSGTPTRSERSASPLKLTRSPMNTSVATLASEARKQPYASSPVPRDQNATSQTGSTMSNRTTIKVSKDGGRDNFMTSPPTPSFSLTSASDSETKEEKGESGFWSLNRWKVPSLRYSMSGSPSSSNGNLSPGTAGGDTRATNELLVPSGKVTSRVSMGISDLDRLTIEDKANGRKSAGPVPTSRLQQAEFRSETTGDRLGSPSKKRVDSGVGYGSSDSIQNGNRVEISATRRWN